MAGDEDICRCERAIIELLVGPELQLSLADAGWSRSTTEMSMTEPDDGVVDLVDGTHLIVRVRPVDVPPKVGALLHDAPHRPEDEAIEIVRTISGDLPFLDAILPVIARCVCDGETLSEGDPDPDGFEEDIYGHVHLISKPELDLEVLAWIPVGTVLDDVTDSDDGNMTDWLTDLSILPDKVYDLLLESPEAASKFFDTATLAFADLWIGDED